MHEPLREFPLDGPWEFARTPAGAFETPDRLDDTLPWHPAIVPGTVAAALHAMGEWDWESPQDLDADDWWYRCRFTAPSKRDDGTYTLGFGGLATVADVWLNGVPLLHSENMFLAHDVEVTQHLVRENELLIRFTALHSLLAVKRPRPRWRTRLVTQQQLRWIRTTLLGRMPGWSASPQPVGPWHDVVLTEHTEFRVTHRDLRTSIDGQDGIVHCMLRLHHTSQNRLTHAALTVGDVTTALSLTPAEDDGELGLSGTLRIPNAERWWPHTHGPQFRYAAHAQLVINEQTYTVSLGSLGFRTVTLDTTDGNFAIALNGTPIFCRGACWSTADVIRLSGAHHDYRDLLQRARDAGVNMLRVGGTMVYESEDFYALCDELGILVWQEFMFSNMDYPTHDDSFLASVREEAEQLLRRVQAHPSLTILCGNNEVSQQAAMLGLSAELWTNPLFDTWLPTWCKTACPDIPYWPSSPTGGTLPFHVNAGDAHYFGYGPYLRAFDDVRTSGVKFASETLALANIPDHAMIEQIRERGDLSSATWKAGVPHDNGTTWDFEDVREHYTEQLFGVQAATLRRTDAERYLALGRITSGEVMARAISAWRRPDSGCRGALIWFWRDLRPGAGWGLLDAAGRPKAAYYFVRRVSQPVILIASDEGLNGIRLDAVNDTALPIEAALRVTLYREDGTVIGQGTRDIHIPARGAATVAADAILERFTDISYAYRFGAPNHDLVVATLHERDTDAPLADAWYFPTGIARPYHGNVGLSATATPVHDGTYRLTLHTKQFAQSVAIEVDGYLPDDNYLHIAPGGSHETLVRPASSWEDRPARFRGTVHPLNAAAVRITIQTA